MATCAVCCLTIADGGRFRRCQCCAVIVHSECADRCDTCQHYFCQECSRDFTAAPVKFGHIHCQGDEGTPCGKPVPLSLRPCPTCKSVSCYIHKYRGTHFCTICGFRNATTCAWQIAQREMTELSALEQHIAQSSEEPYTE